MKEEIEVYHSSGNVFADLELPDAEEMQAKALLSINTLPGLNGLKKIRHTLPVALSFLRLSPTAKPLKRP
jgi:hypothetical protein